MKRLTEKKVLHSVNPEQYPDIEVEFTRYNTATEILNEATSETVSGKKTVSVKARLAKVGDVVDTNPRVSIDGKVYTFSEVKRTVTEEDVKNGSIIVTNPDGEEYFMGQAKFESKYNIEKANEDGSYTCKPKGNIASFKKVVGNVVVNQWGTDWFVTDGGYVANNPDDCYPITNEAFNKTYEVVNSKDMGGKQ